MNTTAEYIDLYRVLLGNLFSHWVLVDTSKQLETCQIPYLLWKYISSISLRLDDGPTVVQPMCRFMVPMICKPMGTIPPHGLIAWTGVQSSTGYRRSKVATDERNDHSGCHASGTGQGLVQPFATIVCKVDTRPLKLAGLVGKEARFSGKSSDCAMACNLVVMQKG